MADAPASPKLFDVARPGKSAADATSRPVIITNRPIMQDPMMSGASDDKDNTPAATAKLPVKIVLKPLSGDDTPPAVRHSPSVKPEDKPEATAETPATDTAKAPPAPAVEDQPDTPEAANQAKKTKAAAAAADQEAVAERQAQLDALVESREYFLPINSVEKRRSKRAVIVGAVAVILLCLVWADIALDMGLIHFSGVQPLIRLLQTK